MSGEAAKAVSDDMAKLSVEDGKSGHGRTEGGRMTTSAGAEIKARGSIGGTFTKEDNPAFLKRRLDVYERLKKKRDEEKGRY